MSLSLLLAGFFLAGLGAGVAAGWWLRGEVRFGQRVTGRTLEFDRRRLGQ